MTLKIMLSENASNADNQQERINMCGWIVGFVDGEGSFLVNIFRSPRAKLGWQVFPEFNVSQAQKGIELLYAIQKFFGCGHIYIHKTRNLKNKRWDPLHKYCVRSQNELSESIIPFFNKYPPRGKLKKKDFELFCKVVETMQTGKHLSINGIKKIVEIVRKMNHRKPFEQTFASKFLSSPETIRQTQNGKI